MEASHSMAKSLLIHGGGAFHRIDHFTPEGIFSIENARAAKRLVGMGRTVGCYDTHYNFFRNQFLAGPPATLHRSRTLAKPDSSTIL